ncbi:MAG: family 16 glycoside hydrolase [Planctomycetaceae bacterium]
MPHRPANRRLADRCGTGALAVMALCLAACAGRGYSVDIPADADWTRRAFWCTPDGGAVSDGWQFEDGEVRLVRPHVGGNIVSPPLPTHFELHWKWRIDAGVNTGLKYRVRRFPGPIFENRFLGLEYQIIDSPPLDTSKGSTGAIYDLVEPVRDKTLHPPGEWNSAAVIAVGDRVEHHLNGRLVASADLAGPAWDTTVALSKFHGSTDFGRPLPGDRVMLTDHGGVAAYKDFRFVPRPAPAVGPPARRGPFLANATRNGWADQTGIVIWTRTTRNPEMLAEGPRFVAIDADRARDLALGSDADELLRLQLPAGATLDAMQHATPGAPGKVRLSYYPDHERLRMRHTDWITTDAEHDCTAQWRLEGLEPNRLYRTVVEARSPEGEPSAVVCGSFRTAPRADEVQPLLFCITTCHDFIRRDDGPRGHKIYPAMEALAPAFVIHAGDVEYYDKPDPWAFTIPLMRFKWGRLFALPRNRDFYAHTTSYFLKDDHDTLANDSWPGTRYGAVSFAEGARLFNDEQFPSRVPRYATVRWGRDLQIWLLEGRDARSPPTLPDGPEKTILGAAQKAWLLETLAASDAPFKVIVSPTPVVGPDRPRKQDNHANDTFAWEGRQLREAFAATPGTLVVCGDRHWQYASVDDGSGLWEFGCGPGSETHELGWKDGDERPEHRFLRVAGGFLSGAIAVGEDGHATLTMRHHDVAGGERSRFTFPRDAAVGAAPRR